MAITVIREVTINPGKTKLMHSRVRRGSGIFARHGAHVRLYQVAGGHGARNIMMQSHYASVSSAATAFQGYSNDPAWHELLEEIENNPAGHMSGPNMVRYIYGDAGQSAAPVVVIRMYEMAREKIAEVMKLAPRLDKMMSELDVGVAAAVPVLSEDHQMMAAIYRFKSISHWGASVDKMMESTDFQTLVNEANDLGTLKNSRLMTLMQ